MPFAIPKPETGSFGTGSREREHSAGCDMTFSAPKSVSVLWVVSDEHGRRMIEQVRQSSTVTHRPYADRDPRNKRPRSLTEGPARAASINWRL
jgi:hypothetical protein